MNEIIAQNIYVWMKEAQQTKDPNTIQKALHVVKTIMNDENKINLDVLDILVHQYHISLTTRKIQMQGSTIIDQGLKYKDLILQI